MRALIAALVLLPSSAWSQEPTPCLVEAYAGERGLEAREAPSADAPVLARLPDPVQVGDGEVAVAFTVTGHVPGWFRVEHAGFSDEVADPPEGRVVPLDRPGWVPEAAVRVTIGAIALRAEPSADAPVAARLQGMARVPGGGFVLFGPEGVGLRRVAACRGTFAEVETDMGRGWTEAACSRQRTACE
ncbi:MAG TPA: hypothetical protein VEA41_10715 [Salinarimonas sp.]|nr:hypothetical protein [Salinarimonas sp.]